MNTGIQIRISDLIFALQKRWKMIVAGTFIGLVFGLILSAMTLVQSPLQTYQVSGSFAILTQSKNGLYSNGYSNAGNNDFHLAEDMADTVLYLLRSNRVLNAVINDQALLGTTLSELKSKISVKQYSATQIIEMSVDWHNPEDAVDIWNAIVRSTSALMPSILQMGSLEVLNEPEAEALGVGGSGKSMPMVLAVLGFIVGVGYAVMEQLVRPTLNNVRDVEGLFGLEILGTIPRDDAYFKEKKSLLTNDGVGNPEITQSYSATAYILRNLLGTREAHHSFFVTSAAAQEGKTTVAASLAVQLSDMEHRTLLIDFDTRNPSLGAMFMEQVDYSRSLNALYRGDATEEEAIIPLTGYLDLLPTVLEHGSIPMDSFVVELIGRLKEKYEYVILDSAPVGMVSDTLSLNQVTSNVLYVIGYDSATVPEIQKSLEKLDKSGLRVIGSVVNGVQSTRNWLNGNKEDKGKPKKAKKKKAAPEGVQEPFPSSREASANTEEMLSALSSAGQEKPGPDKAGEPNPKAPAKEKSAEKARPAKRQKGKKGSAPAPDYATLPPRRDVLRELMEEPSGREEKAEPDMDSFARLSIESLDAHLAPAAPDQASPEGGEIASPAPGDAQEP